jgi:hypothetical protein
VRGGVLDVRMFVDRRVIDACTVGCELLLRSRQSCARPGHRFTCMLQFFA